MQQRTKRSQHLVFGAFARGPFCGITNRTMLCPTCVKYINPFLGKQFPKTMTWSTFALSKQGRAMLHTDVHNLAGSTNCAFLWAKAKVVVCVSRMRGVIVPSKPSRARTSKSSCTTPAASLFVFLLNSTTQCNHGQGFDFLWLVIPQVLCLTLNKPNNEPCNSTVSLTANAPVRVLRVTFPSQEGGIPARTHRILAQERQSHSGSGRIC